MNTFNPSYPHSPPGPVAVAFGRLTAAIARFVERIATPRAGAPIAPEATVQLLRLAARYEASQPSYAADLRAAAMLSMGRRVD